MTQEQFDYADLLLPHNYLGRAHDFYAASRMLPNFHPGFMPMWPQLALFGLAIELVLKGFLLSKGETAEKLKKSYGHNLQKLHSQSIELGLPENPRSERMISFINDTYAIHMPRHPDPQTRHRPVATVPQFFEDYDRLVQSVTEMIA
ncbi:hypothetical protein QA648_34070 (plasmid) [Rhizobium sp. CB3171]|uniref:hypothetical protein n=1 Tax=Rhizobium sp. CB3171 TaxID=3039157 RepID=UPI0024B10EB3|nr:hypothetical protein [Rhizobium sp. CB3171]WFU06808.1 hypothetical protein QA648_34070 [Rhizobium sp. CB3171]